MNSMDFPWVGIFRRKAYNERVDLWSLGVLYLGEVERTKGWPCIFLRKPDLFSIGNVWKCAAFMIKGVLFPASYYYNRLIYKLFLKTSWKGEIASRKCFLLLR